MKEELLVNLINISLPYIKKDDLSDYRWKLEIELSKWDIKEKCTEQRA